MYSLSSSSRISLPSFTITTLTFLLALCLCTLLTSPVQALTLTAPTESNGWTQNGDQIISWTPDASDPETIVVKLIIPLPTIRSPTILSNSVNTSTGSYIYDQPTPADFSGAGYGPKTVLQPGDGYEVILVDHNGKILADSNFTVSTGTSTVTATSVPTYNFIPGKRDD
ncbi:hypothetical protein I316_06423 [Kwoniella heveanensis BCC8398]|uniref:Uncharacterized protein n=1 Tax=Kwoniella heveanensis BCC8398 TaxID=1296120 RepID=A0A1B9GLU2_9TREE|nr:hypothetical protein I316_06423 [Kwoniella heveanensis BCC8398]